MGLAFLAGMSIPAGAFVATRPFLTKICLRYEVDSFVSYFGGGALLAAIALVLIPQGIEHNTTMAAAVAFLAGSICIWRLNAFLKKKGGAASQFMGMLLDYIPESIVLGAVMHSTPAMAYVLAGLIALQNMPEGFAASIEMRKAQLSAKTLWLLFLAAPAVGALSAWLGVGLLSRADPALGLLGLFCSGGILYLIFDDIAPQAHVRYHDFPAIGAVLGFLLGMVGTMMVH